MKKYRLLIFLSLLIVGFSEITFAQSSKQNYQLPTSVSGDGYIRGKLAVKVKSDFHKKIPNPTIKDFKSNSSFLLSIEPLVPKSELQVLRSQRRKPFTIDIGSYYYLNYDYSYNIEEVINSLYATDKFDIVEPCFIDKLFYVPTDPLQSQQYYLDIINAFEAWDITKGDTNVVVAIIDSGVEYDHPDLMDNIYINYADPINGIDDDGDGFLDNYYGWDFVGADSADFKPDNDPRPANVEGNHGIAVAGCVSASTDNNIGISGVGFKTKLMALKHGTANNGRSVYMGYSGILYAANHGADIANCSWGGNTFSQIAQDICTYATVDQGMLIVASAGNDNNNRANYPASFDYVLSVASSDENDLKSSFSNFGTKVDIIAPGSDIYTTNFGKDYLSISGTSFSGPITAGAAALVKAQYPDFGPIEIGEVLRVTADEGFYNTAQSKHIDFLGKGRLDIHAALTKKSPSIRFENANVINPKTQNIAVAGDTAIFFGDFKNILWPSSPGLNVSISINSFYLKVLEGNLPLGVIEKGLSKSNSAKPFRISIDPNTPKNTEVDIKIVYSDPAKNYYDYQYFTLLLNPSYTNIVENNISTSLTDRGRLGYDDDAQTRGIGFQYKDGQLLYEMGMVLGNSETKISSTIRGSGSSFDADFKPVESILVTKPGNRADFEATGKFNDDNAGGAKSNVEVSYTAYAWSTEPFQNTILLEYDIKNNSSEILNDFYAGLYADWDISENGAKDFASWNAENKLGYIYNWDNADTTFGGIQVLEGNANYYAIANDNDAPDVDFGVYDGFSDEEKYTALSSGVTNDFAGSTTHTNSDVSHVVSAEPFTIPVGEEVRVVLALHGAGSFEELIASAEAASMAYNVVLQITKPTASNVDVCYGDNTILTASGATTLKWYRQATGGDAFAVGNSISVNNVRADSTFYVSNADDSRFESARTKVIAKTKANPKVTVLGSSSFCEGDSITLTVAEADSYLWTEIGSSNTFSTQNITVKIAEQYKVEVVDNTLACMNESDIVTTSILSAPIANFTLELQSDLLTVEFTNTSTDAVSYSWDFGNGSTSDEQNPTHTYSTVETFQVELTAIGENGCEAKVSQSVIVTALENSTFSKKIAIYPNPSEGKFNLRMEGIASGEYKLEVYDLTGKLMMKKSIKSNGVSFQGDLNVSSLKSGQYLVQITGVDGVAVKRITKL